MIGDVMLFSAISYCIYFVFIIKSPLLIFIVGCVSIFSLQSWYETGSFEAWRPSRVKLFMRNAKKMGL